MPDLPVLRAGFVERQRLRDSLRLAPELRLILVSAPAGFGKTSLLSDWLRTEGVAHGWVSLSASDDDPVRFARGIIAALAADPERLASQPFAPGAGVGVDEAAAAILEALGGKPRPTALILDDYHVVGAAVNALVARLVERLPPGVVLVIGTRADPPLPLARLRARGELVEVRGEALRFTTEEAGRFLCDTMGLGLDDAQAAALATRTEGWAAGLQLAGLALREQADADGFIRRFSGTNRFVLDYLVDEVLSLQPGEVQGFLLDTSVLERLTGDLCDAVTGGPGGQVMLERLERENLFLLPLDEERRWFRYHRLFADLLHARLLRDRPGDEPGLHDRAAAWFRDRGEADDAIRHALAAGDVALAVDVIGDHWVPYGHRGEVATVRRWLDALPASIVGQDALLSAAYAWMLVLAGEHEGVEQRLEDAERACAAAPPAESSAWVRSVPAQAALMRSALALARGDVAVARAQAERVLALIPPDLDRALSAVLMGEASLTLGQALASLGEPELAAAAARDALPLLWEGGNPFGVGMGAMRLADLETQLGRPDAALETCRTVLEQARTAGLDDSPAMAPVHLALGRVHLAGHDAAAAQREAGIGRELALRGGQLAAVRAAERLLERASAEARAGAAPLGTAASIPEPLTARETDVLRLLVRGRSNRQIADELFLSVGTVKFHVHAVLGKLGATSRLDAVARARSRGLVR